MAEVIAVSALNKYVKSLLDGDPLLNDIALRGEISNLHHHHASGHYYFTLKDEKASVKAVLFSANAKALSFKPQDGMAVLARCRVSLFERDGSFQIYVEALFPDGVGAAGLAFEQLKNRLREEGMFAPERKKPLPPFPRCVGLVTSKTGAALQDILKVAETHCPAANFLLCPVSVQGRNAAAEVAAAIATLDATGKTDVIIVARGGGSFEDLNVFNDEGVARAAFACKTPLVSAIGHEVDYTILDFVADLRAPTPSAAAEMVLPDLANLRAVLWDFYANLQNNMQSKLDSCYNKLNLCRHHAALALTAGRPAASAQQLAETTAALQAAMCTRLQQAQQRMQHAAQLAESLSPYAVLARGYAVAATGGRVVRSAATVHTGQQLDVTLHDGVLSCRVQHIHPHEGEPVL